ncbi:hypothetical protein KIH39_23245 [Telmatocola sphagniphila]|uniref:DNA-directed DNA polymerase n=1 Tax=Telmatocola sphagniphila TaxID=1123043 RepID=A0A8E6B3X7_9BACT|nr:DNA polymerase [Telmatocola sphagniphila]QVL31725.1 hypothetical protein KIH39_23245 [Telmatocola sphagniphila]
MNIQIGNINYKFSPWKLSNGRIFSGPISIDTETLQIDRQRDWIAPPLVMAAAFSGNRGVFLPRESVADFLHCHSQNEIVFHNAAFDLTVLEEFDESLFKRADANRIWDTMILYKLYRLATAGDLADKESKLDDCALEILALSVPKDIRDDQGNDVRTSFGRWLGKPPSQIETVYLEYLARDVAITHMLYERLRGLIESELQTSREIWGRLSANRMNECLHKWGPLTHHIQLKASLALKGIHGNGLTLNRQECQAAVTYFQTELETHLKILRAEGYLGSGKGSQESLQKILKRVEKDIGVQLPRTQKSTDQKDRISTSEDSLQEYANRSPFLNSLFLSKRFESLLKLLTSRMDRPTLHPSFQFLVRSGRTSSFGDLNAQNLPRDHRVRRCFVPSPGHYLVKADYKMIELVALAEAIQSQFGKSSRMAEEINKGTDLHKLVAAQVLQISPEQVTKADRAKAKPINFGTPGGMGARSLAHYAKTSYEVEMTEQEAEKFRDGYFALFPEIREFLASDIPLQIAQYLNLTPAEWKIFNPKAHTWKNTTADENTPCPILGGMCLKVLGQQEPRSQKGILYSPEYLDFFWTSLNKVATELENPQLRLQIIQRTPSVELRNAMISLAGTTAFVTLSGRIRARASYTQRHNGIFQGIAADGAKLALWNLFRANYRIVNFVHDEMLIEVPESRDPEEAKEHISQIMVRAMKEVLPNMRVEVDIQHGSSWAMEEGDSQVPSVRISPASPGQIPTAKADTPKGSGAVKTSSVA